MPPDLTQLAKDSRYAVPGGVVSANRPAKPARPQPSVATRPLSSLGDVRIERAGNQRWLGRQPPADKLWDPVREFWLENGFMSRWTRPTSASWKPTGPKTAPRCRRTSSASTLGKVLDSLYSTGERDKFRTRLERNANGATDIYISHRGMIEEVYTTKDQTVWQPRAADPELETEFLRRLMVKLGVSQRRKRRPLTATAPTQQTPAARIATVNNAPWCSSLTTLTAPGAV